MTTLHSILGTSVRSMQVNQIGISVASNNIANAQTPGYSRQRMLTVPGISNLSGNGVHFVGIEALRSQLIDGRLRQETAMQSESEELDNLLSHIQTLFNDSDGTGLGPEISAFFNSFQNLSLDPSSVNLRQQIISSATALMDALRTRSQQMARFQLLTNDDIPKVVSDINALTKEIATLTKEIRQQEVGNVQANDLRDRRSALVQQLAELADVHVVESNGNFQVWLGNGRALVANDMALSLSVQKAPTSPMYQIYSGSDDITSEIRGGQLEAKLRVRDSFIPAYQGALDQLAYDIADKVNTIHRSGYTLNGTTSVDFFAPPGAVSGAAQQLQLSAAVTADPRNVAASAQSSGNDNQLALQLAGLLNARVFGGGTVLDQYGALVYQVGSDVGAAQGQLAEHKALAHQLQTRRDAISGVSIDEETVQMIQFQRSFEASARMIKAVDELLQTVLGMVG